MLAIAVALALAATPTISLDKLLAKPTTQVRSQTKLKILLPKALPVADAGTTLYAKGSGSRDRYSIRLTSTPNCTANYCFAATFSGERGSRKPLGTAIKLAKGRKGVYDKMSCGASCAPASISWSERGATYRFEVMIPLDSDQRALLAAMANAAIKRGPR